MDTGRRCLLFLVTATMMVIWLVVLPRVARFPAMQRHIERNRDRQIQADAMFYTDVGPLRGVTIEHRRGEPIILGRMRIGQAEPE